MPNLNTIDSAILLPQAFLYPSSVKLWQQLALFYNFKEISSWSEKYITLSEC
jgi:hypothetical protein